MRISWSAGKVIGVTSLVVFVIIATLARVDAARHPEREWRPSLAGLPNPGARSLPEMALAPVPIEEDGAALSVELGAGLSQPGDAAVLTVPQLPPSLLIVLDAGRTEGRLRWDVATSEYSLASLDADGALTAIERYPVRATDGEVSLTLIRRDDGGLGVWVGLDYVGKMALGRVEALTMRPADQLGGLSVQLGQVQR